MTDWTAGYVADIGYTFGYYNELNPLRIKLAFLSAGLAIPEFGTACELGFGQGLSANIHAAASVTRWYGTDFNPAQAGFAQELASEAESEASLYDEAFEEFAQRSDLPEFDYIGLHGIWSWISDDNRRVIVDFVRRKLKVGGVLYISYNILPGWAAFAPMRHLMTEHAEIIGSEGRGIVSRIDDAIDFADKLLDTNPLFARANPLVADRVKKLKGQNRHYLAHEYFNKDWHPMHFATMAEWLETSKLSYACSADYISHIDSVNLTEEQQKFLAEIPDVMFRESVRDFMVNQQFRRDYWVKGPRKLSSLDQVEAIRTQRVILVNHRPDITLKVTGALGEATMNESIYDPLLDLLSDHKSKSIGDIDRSMSAQGVTTSQTLQAIMVLIGGGHVSAVQEDTVINKAKKHTVKLNSYIARKSRSGNDIAYLASPVTGGGVMTPRFNQLFLQAIAQGKKTPLDWAQFTWDVLRSQGQALVKDGRALESEENITELHEQAEEFSIKRVPILKALQII